MGRIENILCLAIATVGCAGSPIQKDLLVPVIADAAMPVLEIESAALISSVHTDSVLEANYGYLHAPEPPRFPYEDLGKMCGTTYFQNRVRVMAETTHFSADYNSHWDRVNGRDATTVYYHFSLKAAPITTRKVRLGLWTESVIP